MFKTLIVDDNKIFRDSLHEMLSAQFPAMSIAEAWDSCGALTQVQNFDPDLIFMDIKLPDNSGLSLTQTIKNTHTDATVIIITSYDYPEYRQAAFQSGASHFVPKGSSSSEEILALVESIVSERAAH